MFLLSCCGCKLLSWVNKRRMVGCSWSGDGWRITSVVCMFICFNGSLLRSKSWRRCWFLSLMVCNKLIYFLLRCRKWLIVYSKTRIYCCFRLVIFSAAIWWISGKVMVMMVFLLMCIYISGINGMLLWGYNFMLLLIILCVKYRNILVIRASIWSTRGCWVRCASSVRIRIGICVG